MTIVGSVGTGRKVQIFSICVGIVLECFWNLDGNAVSQIVGEWIPLNPRLMLLLDVDHFRLQNFAILLANLLTAASLLLAKHWKLQVVPDLIEWLAKIRFTCLMIKLLALSQ